MTHFVKLRIFDKNHVSANYKCTYSVYW